MSLDPKRICILGASFNTSNMGVSVLAAGAIRCVLHRFPQAEIVQMDYAREGYTFPFAFNGEQRSIRFFNIRFSKTLLPNNIAVVLSLILLYRMIPLASFRTWLLSTNECLSEVFSTELFVSLAGGDSFSDIYGLRRLLYITLPQLIPILAGKTLVLLPQTIGPFRYGASRRLAAYVLRNASLVYSRQQNLDEVRRLMGRSADSNPPRFCYDLGFEVDHGEPHQMAALGVSVNGNRQRPLVGFNVSGLLSMGGYTENNMFGLKMDYQELTSLLIRSLIEEKSADVLLVPHVFGSAGESDTVACEKLFHALQPKYGDRIGLLRGEGAYDEVKYFIGKCDFFVGARMHACIGALSQGVPAVSIAYSEKFAGVMKSIGVSGLVVDPRTMDGNQALGVLNQAFANRTDLRQSLQEKMPQVKAAVRAVLAEI